MSNTPNLDLKLFGDTDLFSAFHAGLAGEGSGANKSNMQKIDEWAADIAKKAVLVTLTHSGGSWTSDTTFAQIEAALTAGRHVYLSDGEGILYQLAGHAAGNVVDFIGESFTDETHYCFSIDNTNAVTRTSWSGGAPAAYLKSVTISVDGNTATFIDQDNTPHTFSPTGGGGGTYHGMPISSSVAWGYETPAGSITPDVTLPDVPNPRNEATELVYIFTAASANADFTPPSAYILGDEEDGFAGMDPGDTISYTNLTIGSIYEISFKVLDSTHISLIKKEHKTE